ncbi:MAG: response regulator transcription factor [Rhodocyclaceae bacterium]|nr:response regulator transcription factor [Rhodocyclaceae bacterium]
MASIKPEAKSIAVLLVCDLPVSAWGLEKLLASREPFLRCLGTAATPTAALRVLDEHAADVILLDLDGDNDVAAISELLASRARVLVLTSAGNLELHDAAILAGASGAVSKREPVEVLFKAIEKVQGGEFWIDRAATMRIMMTIARQKATVNPESEKIARLTRKERLTAAEVARDATASSEDIAARLHISQHTLRNHLSSIYAKLGVANRTALYAFANRHGLNGRSDATASRMAESG